MPADALQPFGPVAEAQDALWDLAYPIAIGVFVLVFAGLAYILVRFRDKGQEELPVQTHGNTRLEIVWTIIPALILVVIAIPTVQTIFDLAREPDPDSLIIDVVGKQYWWEFRYEEAGIWTASELHIPTGRDIYIRLDGSEPGNTTVYGQPPVMHSFWVPSLAGKRDYVPGAIREMRIQADEPGVYPGNCAEFCGLSHANMRFTVIAHSPEDYEAWVASQQEPALLAQDELVQQGQELFVSGACIGCHNITGHPDVDPDAPSRVGPDLTHFAAREAFAGYIFDSPFGEQVEDPDQAMENLRAWIRNSSAIKPGSHMPATQVDGAPVDGEQLDAIIAYLATLE
ncbi:cytochrome c oxidase subunit II [Euzebya tangerina]|uniref:cytochrome c oxidase subunit II n=1 Tax=Euzebya tangerina TaxID=591198 RepID=UPI0013C31BBF|nr:cytochrome c oxidase subunit II [Euzebya tangerina]